MTLFSDVARSLHPLKARRRLKMTPIPDFDLRKTTLLSH
jgi:hypothetical protein